MNTATRTRLTLLFGALPLLLAGGDHLAQGATLVGVLTVGVGALNLLAVLLSERLPPVAFIMLSAASAAAALATAYLYYRSERSGLPYVWLTAGALYCYAAYQFYRRGRAG
ncbi:MAG: hypothetical protein WBA12_10185 [Catalinimonas sp.]